MKLSKAMLAKIEHLSDERAIGNGWIVTLHYGWAIDPAERSGCHVFGADTLAELRSNMELVQPCHCAECRDHGAA
jgi:hypothetical protein